MPGGTVQVASCRRIPAHEPARANPGRGQERESRCLDVFDTSRACSWLIVFARHRDGPTVAEIAPARRSQPGVLTGKRLHRWFVKSRARNRAARPCAFADGGTTEKGFVRQSDCADEAGCLSRGREKRSGPGTSRRKLAALRSHSETRTEELMPSQTLGTEAASSPPWSEISDQSGSLAEIGASEPGRSGRNLAALLRRPWPWRRGSRSRPSAPATGSHRAPARFPSAATGCPPSAPA